MKSTGGNAFEPVASQSTGTTPAGDTSTAGSSASPPVQLVLGCNVGDESCAGVVGGEARAAGEGALPPVRELERGAPSSLLMPRSGPSLLDTQRITRPGCADRRAWLGEVERGTQAHRVRKAQHHWRRATQVKAERLAEGKSYEQALEGMRWHQMRSYGQINRFERVAGCETETFWLLCQACNRVKEKTRACRLGLLCVTCRGAIGQEKRTRFRMGRQRAVDRAKAVGLFWPGRDGGRWTEKLMTLTLPHLEQHGVSERILAAWRAIFLFRKALKKWLEACDDAELVAWFRTFEWTPGRDGRGHPHFHFWLLCPFLDPHFVRRAWAQALRTAGFPKDSVQNVVVHLQLVRDGERAANEVIKYLTKDILPDRSFVDPAVFSEVYEMLDGKRVTQPSAGFFLGLDSRATCECGASGAFKRLAEPPAQAGGASSAPGASHGSEAP